MNLLLNLVTRGDCFTLPGADGFAYPAFPDGEVLIFLPVIFRPAYLDLSLAKFE